jgi:gamma-glutamylcyclotransferase (GGCT)/AIG2-like uncharacterized protein YtfP
MSVDLFVNGTLMRGLALHHNLDGAEFVGVFHTAPVYRLYSIDDDHPGMFEVETGGVSVAGEIYHMSDDLCARVESGEPPLLYRGPVKLSDGGIVDDVLIQRDPVEGHYKDISDFGDWRAYIATLRRD